MRLDWNKLISSKRLGHNLKKLETDIRTEFEKDIDRIIFSSAFRRLQNKTQVFPIPKSDFIHTRLTHSIEVASIGRTLGRLAGDFVIGKEGEVIDSNSGKIVTSDDFANIVAAACMCHDIGNPPFGHSGEESFRQYFENYKENSAKKVFDRLSPAQKDDFLRFEGNAEGFRILTNDHSSKVPGGLKLTYSTLSAFCKYTRGGTKGGESDFNKLGKELSERRSCKKVGFFQSEKSIFEGVAKEMGLLKLSDKQIYYTRHPLAFIMEAADNISYQIMDLEDGHKLKLISTEEVIDLLMPLVLSIKGDPCDIKDLIGISDDCERVGAFRAKSIHALIYQCFEVFKNNYDKIMTGQFDSELTDLIRDTESLEKIAKQKKKKLFNYSKVVAIESSGRYVISELLELYIDAYNNKNKKYGENIINTLPTPFRIDPDDEPYHALLKISGYLSRMTDPFAIDHFRSYTGHKIPEII